MSGGVGGKVHQVGKNNWKARWWFPDPGSGERLYRERAGFKLKKDAEPFLHDTLAKLDAGTWVADSDLTVRQLLLDYYLPTYQRRLREAPAGHGGAVPDGRHEVDRPAHRRRQGVPAHPQGGRQAPGDVEEGGIDPGTWGTVGSKRAVGAHRAHGHHQVGGTA